MVYRVDLTARAIRDLRKLYQSLNASHSKSAQTWFNGLEAAILSLETSPARHPVTPENAQVRHLLYSSQSYVYRVIFKIDDNKGKVVVLHIRHGSRQAI